MTKPLPRRLQKQTQQPGDSLSSKQYYFLAAGIVYMHEPDSPDQIMAMPCDAVFANTTGLLPTSSLAQAQRGLQQRASDRAGKPMQIVDCHLQSISKLGHMTPAEFHDLGDFKPEGDPREQIPG